MADTAACGLNNISWPFATARGGDIDRQRLCRLLKQIGKKIGTRCMPLSVPNLWNPMACAHRFLWGASLCHSRSIFWTRLNPMRRSGIKARSSKETMDPYRFHCSGSESRRAHHKVCLRPLVFCVPTGSATTKQVDT